MKLDRIDLQIIEIISSGEPDDSFTTSYIAKQVYQPDDLKEIKSLDPKIRQRLEKMADYGIVKKTEGENGTKNYNLRTDKIIYGSGEIKVDTSGKSFEHDAYKFSPDGILFVENDEGFYVNAFVPKDN
ncbi:MAG: hypothetical protein ABEI78_02430 [Candidatus Nanohaloarchaea archaeon]